MAWYRTGTVAVTNGSTTITGTGTAWVANAVAGMGVILPDARLYEIAAVVSNTSITLAAPYLGSTAAAQTYVIVPTRGPELKVAQDITAMVATYGAAFETAGQGRFSDGTLAAPGLRFAADENTGFYRPGSDQIAGVVGGVLRMLLSSTGLEVTGLITGAAVTQSVTDITSGRLLRADHAGYAARSVFGGYWTTASARNIDTVPDGDIGLYSKNSPGTFPVDAPAFVWVETQKIYSGLSRVQVATAYAPSGTPPATGAQRWYRIQSNSGEWGAWRAQFDRGSILGTVSQSAGVPTGAIIERGSNANGQYVRFADGTQICTFDGLTVPTCNTAVGALFESPTGTWTYPAAFAATPVASFDAGNTRFFGTGAQNTTTSCPFRIMSPTSASGSLAVSAMAIGRWF